MSRKKKIIAGASLIALGVLIFVGIHTRSPETNAPRDPSSPDVSTESFASQTQANVNPVPNATPATQALRPEATQSQRQEDLKAAALAHNHPIDFWGKTVAQDGTPLSAVRITFFTRTFAINSNDLPLTYFPKRTVQSGTDGLFEIHGAMGDSLQIESIEKDGYEPEPGVYGAFSYDPGQGFAPSAEKPVIFRLWRKGLNQELIVYDRFITIVPDGRPYAVDLLGKAVTDDRNAEGDFRISTERPDAAQQKQNFEWTFHIYSQTGGFVQELDRQYLDMTLAPLDGYTNSYRSVHSATDSSWTRWETEKRFYIKLRDGKTYGRLQIGVDSFYDKNTGSGKLHIQYAVNPSGSPILR